MIRSNETTEQRRQRIDTQWLAMKRREAADVAKRLGYNTTAGHVRVGLYDKELTQH